MNLTFNVQYRTNWGESLFICGDINPLGLNDVNKSIPMTLSGYDTWTCNLELPDNITEFNYNFIVKSESGLVRQEWGNPHNVKLSKKLKECLIESYWQDQPFNKHYFSSAFVCGVNCRETRDKQLSVEPNKIFIKIAAPNIRPDEVLAISGDIKDLGNWDANASVKLNDYNFPIWEAAISVKSAEKFSYKFLILNKNTGEVVAWEQSANREMVLEKSSKTILLDGLMFNDPKGNWRGAGTAIPVFSLRSEDDFGVGDFYDLYKMIDWAVLTGQNFVQLLPINDTTMTHTWTDSYPYNANSTFALHPMFLRLEAVGQLKDKSKTAEFNKLRVELNSLTEVDYEKVNNYKINYLKDIYKENGAKTLKLKAFKDFVKSNEHWLTDYAAFCVLRDKFNTPDFKEWKSYSVYDKKKIAKFISENSEEINFIYFLQYHLDKQLSEVRNYAHANGVVLKGDIPIGISRTSADAWVNPRLFNMDCQAGAPPDDFSIMGQNWGFPTYNWEEMNKDGFKWWKDRFRKMSQYFDAYRIDHILGFFRIWEIPMDAVHGLLGTFNPALPFSKDELRNNYDFWLDEDLQTRPFIADYMLGDFFGEYTDYVKENFLIPKGNGYYNLKPLFDTQRKVVEYFKSQEKSERNNRIQEALLGLIDQVLFIEDKEVKGLYHPRITAQYTYTYKALNDYEKWCFDRLYNDFFYHRHNDFWYGKAMWKLPPLINSTDMLVCGEDLGMIPDCVSAVMNSQQILSLEIQRMPKDPKAEFGNTDIYPYLSVGTTSTHDMSGIRGWWEEDREKSQHYFNNVLHEYGAAPYYAEPWICDKIISAHLNSPSMLAIIPLQDWLSINGDIRRNNPLEEQINIPANSRHYWRYRMHLTLENLISKKEFNMYLKDKIKNSGR